MLFIIFVFILVIYEFKRRWLRLEMYLNSPNNPLDALKDTWWYIYRLW